MSAGGDRRETGPFCNPLRARWCDGVKVVRLVVSQKGSMSKLHLQVNQYTQFGRRSRALFREIMLTVCEGLVGEHEKHCPKCQHVVSTIIGKRSFLNNGRG